MKKLLSLLLVLICCSLEAAHVQFNWADVLGHQSTITNNPVILYPISTPRPDGSYTVISSPYFTNTASGITIVSNLITGYYIVNVKDTNSPAKKVTTFTILVPVSSALINGNTLFTAPTNVFGLAVLDGIYLRTGTNLIDPTLAGAFFKTDGTNGYWGPGGILNMDASQFAMVGNNASIKSGAVVTGIVAKASVSGNALSLEDGASITITNGNLNVKSNSIIALGTSSPSDGTPQLRFGRSAYATDYTGTEQWNMKTAVGGGADANTVAKIGNLNTASNALATQIQTLPPVSFPYLVAEGDSLTTGQYAEDGLSYLTKLTNMTEFFLAGLTNWALSGHQALDMVGEYGTQIHPCAPDITNGMNRVFFFWAGINDIRNGFSGGGTYTHLSNEWLMARNDNYKVVAFTIPIFSAAQGSNAANEAQRIDLNNRIKGDRSKYDWLIDADVMFNTLTGRVDGIHLDAANNFALARFINTNMTAELSPRMLAIGGTHKGMAIFQSTDDSAYAGLPILRLMSANGAVNMDFSYQRIGSSGDLWLDPQNGVGHVYINKLGFTTSYGLTVFGASTANLGILSERGHIDITGGYNFRTDGSLLASNAFVTNGLTLGPSGTAVTNILTGSAALDFSSTSPGTNSESRSITVTGTTTNDVAILQAPPVVWNIPNAVWTATCSNDAVWVKFTHNGTNGAPAIDPGNAQFRAMVIRW